MNTTPNKAFLDEIGKLVDEAPMNPTEIQRDGQRSAYVLSEELFNSLMEKAQAYDDMVGSPQEVEDEAEMLAELDRAVQASSGISDS